MANFRFTWTEVGNCTQWVHSTILVLRLLFIKSVPIDITYYHYLNQPPGYSGRTKETRRGTSDRTFGHHFQRSAPGYPNWVSAKKRVLAVTPLSDKWLQGFGKRNLTGVGKARIKVDMEAVRVHGDQVIGIQSLDLTNSEEVCTIELRVYLNETFTDEIYCLASCMEKNYFTAAFVAQAVMGTWTTELKRVGECDGAQKSRHIVFTASTAALVAVPGYAAYSPSKAAIRALADSLRQESLMYPPAGAIQVHCSFPGTFYTDSFYREQARKPQLCKEIEGTVNDGGGLTAKDVAQRVLVGLDSGCYFIPTDLQTRLLLNNMRGPSPRDYPLLDWCMGWAASLVWPIIGTYLDWKVARSGGGTV
ncbi:hypothetical protein ASPNIDRAFT_51907 [Aspergillus niger ATCC 1015]|uniref:Uncharacterized protein n=1 Tax=Aspergillus niger (strain ATCC 1015 / CBS 113.46 / FGSC A1144 / LSHB Ac4 / NCTC 3858a / NRRL 328 / USDA 3528.7) TaxID=380704 RepID=G3XSU3_ASPNA|nr:hypothetical protein ASPNIDRAFT_51907 [Aspergillus niger ATCC 1015]